jgi:hypothetical protein
MTNIKNMLIALFTLVLVNVGIAQADSSNFAGPYVGMSGSGYGIQLSGESNSTSGGTTETDNVSLGQVAPVVGGEVGYAIPIGSMMLLDIGGSFYSGEAKLDYKSEHSVANDKTDRDVSLTIDNLVNYYIAPTLVLSDTSSVYVKIGVTEADVTVSGDITSPGNLSGETWAMGTRTVLSSGIFIRTEAGYTNYNAISSHGKGTTIANTSTYSAEPTIAFGAVSLGFRF